MTRFKICGLGETEHALVAAEAGADFLGFAFVEGVRRQLLPDQAESIISRYRDSHGPGGPKLVGLFANQTVDFVNESVRRCGLDLVQLCGAEDAGYWEQMTVPVLRQIRVKDEGLRAEVIAAVIARAEHVIAQGHTPQLDTYRPGAQGGTGHSFDWSIAAEVALQFEIMLAGGLTPDNVGDAIAVAQPWCVDVSTGVEKDGVKDPAKIVAFADGVREADSKLG